MSPTRTSLLQLLLLTSTLAAIPVLQATGVQIIRAPESFVAPNGDEVKFECETSLSPERFEWSHRSSSLQNATTTTTHRSHKFKNLDSSDSKWYNITEYNATSKLLVYVRPDSLGEYRCIAWFGPVAFTSTTAHLELASIQLDENSQAAPKTLHWRVTTGNTVLVQCGNVISHPPPTWSFFRNGVKVKQSAIILNNTLVLLDVSAADSGTYTCVATNTVSDVRLTMPRSIELQVVSHSGQGIAPHFLPDQIVEKAITVRKGESLQMLCPGVGTPKPTAVWSRPDAPFQRRNTPYALQISDVQEEDGGTYICYLDNGIKPPLEHFVKVTVQQAPRITRAPDANLTNEGTMLQLECIATGTPTPEIYWLLNGKSSTDYNEAKVLHNGFLVLRSVEKSHAGYVQCFAKNILGEQSAGTLLQVNPKQITGEGKHMSGNRPARPPHGRKQSHMEPPSAPNVTRLSDESVMLRWYVARNNGLPIQFFKVQYRTLSDGRNSAPKNWQTTNENIPYGKPKWNSLQGKSFTASVTNLKPQRSYRFRIMAVYSNNDNKESLKSAKFFLQRGSSLVPLAVPELVDIKKYSESAVVLHWRLSSDADEQLISGYYAYYRPSSSAGEFSKATIEGARTRSFQINSLESGTIYEFKLQSFNAVSASEFSALKQGPTQKPSATTTEQPPVYVVDTTTPSQNETFSMNPMLTGTIGGGALLLLALTFACLCVCRRRNERANVVKPRIGEDFVPIGACAPNNKTRPRHIHITLNPLSQHEEKNSATSQDNELSYLQRQPAYDADTNGFNGLRRMSSSSLRRSQRTLERCGVGGTVVAGGAGGNNNNLNQTVDGELTPTTDTSRLQAGNKSARVILKRTRLSSRSDNLSSGSLNSVGV